MKRKRKLGLAAVLGATAAAVVLVFAATASESTTTSHLVAYVASTNRGPLPACSNDCGPANTVWEFIHVVNSNRLTNLENHTTRATLPNTFAITSIDSRVFVNGVEHQELNAPFTPPPDASLRSWSGRWPATVTCPADGSSCNLVANPAVVPGENTAALYAGWVHGGTEPNGIYVFRYTIHGTLNGTPVDLTASSPPIALTP